MPVETVSARRIRNLDERRRFELLVNAVTDYAIFMMDTDGTVATWNPGAQRIKGYTAREIIGQHFSRFYTDEDRAAGRPDIALATASREGRYEAEGWRIRKDGSRFWASVVIDAIYDDGALIGFAKITRDITERRNAQLALQNAEARAAQSQRMEALAQLTGGVAHDFNNLLTIVSGHAQLLGRRVTERRLLRSIEAIQHAAARGENLTRQLLSFSRSQAFNQVVVRLQDRIDGLRELLTSSLRGNINVVIRIEQETWPVEVDLAELELALVNIAVNARDAMPKGGSFTISAENFVMEPNYPVRAMRGDFVVLSITDTGAGIAPDALPRIFEPFFTTKDVDKGTGLGLSQVYGFARQSGGTVDASSEVGKGTTIKLYLPRSRRAVAEAATNENEPKEEAGSGRILMVEDNLDVARVTRTLLRELGYTVVRATNAKRALDILAADQGFDLVFSDVVMPGGINGAELAQEIRQRHPRLPVLLTSGYTKALEEGLPDSPMLRKPYQLSALREAIKGAIARPLDPGRASVDEQNAGEATSG